MGEEDRRRKILRRCLKEAGYSGLLSEHAHETYQLKEAPLGWQKIIVVDGGLLLTEKRAREVQREFKKQGYSARLIREPEGYYVVWIKKGNSVGGSRGAGTALSPRHGEGSSLHKMALTMEELQNELDRFTGTEKYYRHFTGGKFTDGVKHLADRAEAHWLIDAIFSYQIKRKIRDLPFQIWTLKVLRSELGKSKSEPMAILEMREDTDAPILVSQKIPFTDFPEGEVKLYLIDGVLLLPSEY